MCVNCAKLFVSVLCQSVVNYAYVRLRSSIATGTIVMRLQYLANGRSRLDNVLSLQCNRSNVVISVDMKSSSGGGRCRGYLGNVASFFGGSQVCVMEVRALESGGDRLREPHVLLVSHSLSLSLLMSCLRLCRVSLVLAVKVLDLLV